MLVHHAPLFLSVKKGFILPYSSKETWFTLLCGLFWTHLFLQCSRFVFTESLRLFPIRYPDGARLMILCPVSTRRAKKRGVPFTILITRCRMLDDPSGKVDEGETDCLHPFCNPGYPESKLFHGRIQVMGEGHDLPPCRVFSKTPGRKLPSCKVLLRMAWASSAIGSTYFTETKIGRKLP